MNLVGDMARPCTSSRPDHWSGVQIIWTRCFGCRLVGRSHPHGATLTKETPFLSRGNASRAGPQTTPLEPPFIKSNHPSSLNPPPLAGLPLLLSCLYPKKLCLPAPTPPLH